MRLITNKILQCVGNSKAYYPFFMASDYTPLEYSAYYVRI